MSTNTIFYVIWKFRQILQYYVAVYIIYEIYVFPGAANINNFSKVPMQRKKIKAAEETVPYEEAPASKLNVRQKQKQKQQSRS